MVNGIVADIEGCEALIVYSQTWEQRIGQLRHLFEKLLQAILSAYLVKSKFCQANVVYLGHVVFKARSGRTVRLLAYLILT